MQIVNNKTNYQFETTVEDHKAVLQYRIKEETMFFMHTGVPKPIEGQGIASKLAKFGLDYAIENKMSIVIYCPFVVAYVQKHQEYLEFLNTKYQNKDRFKS